MVRNMRDITDLPDLPPDVKEKIIVFGILRNGPDEEFEQRLVRSG